jgi:hypothetical protein
VCVCVCLSVYLSVCVSVCLSASLSVCMYTFVCGAPEKKVLAPAGKRRSLYSFQLDFREVDGLKGVNIGNHGEALSCVSLAFDVLRQTNKVRANKERNARLCLVKISTRKEYATAMKDKEAEHVVQGLRVITITKEPIKATQRFAFFESTLPKKIFKIC